MAQLLNSSQGEPWYCDYTPASLVNAGDVVVSGDTLLICNGGAQINGAGTGISANRMGAMCWRGGTYLVAVDATLPAPRQKIYWDPVNSCVTLTSGTNKRFGYMGDVQATVSGQIVPAVFEPELGDEAVTTIEAAGAGSANTDATPLVDGYNKVTGANATVGVVLPAAAKGRKLYLKNIANAVLKLWPDGSGNTINQGGAGAALSVAAYASCMVESDGTNWYTTPNVPS
jgi:hypothetical protein